MTSQSGYAWPTSSFLADARDVRAAYAVFLGRAVESPEALQAKLGRSLPELAGDFLFSTEFLEGIAAPLLCGEAVGADRFTGAPSGELRRWTALRLGVEPAQRGVSPTFVDWTGLWRAIVRNPRISDTLDLALGKGGARALNEALALRRNGLSTASSPRPDSRLDPRLAPALSVVVSARDDLRALAACALVEPHLCLRTELLVVDIGSPVSPPAWVEALRDAGRPVQHVIAAQQDELSAVLEAARGDYLILSGEPLTPGVMTALAHALVVHDRPEGLRLKKVLAVRTDAFARMLRQDQALTITSSQLAARLMAQGGRLETIEDEANEGMLVE